MLGRTEFLAGKFKSGVTMRMESYLCGRGEQTSEHSVGQCDKHVGDRGGGFAAPFTDPIASSFQTCLSLEADPDLEALWFVGTVIKEDIARTL